MLIIFCFALAWAIQGAAVEAWSSGRAATGSAGRRVRARTAAARKSSRPGVRAAAWTATGAGWAAYGAWRGARATDDALARGARAGWAKGRQKGLERRARRTQERTDKAAERDGTGEPTWRHWVTGECPVCGHSPKASPSETDGCECGHVDWACPCALRHRSATRQSAPGGGPPIALATPPPRPPRPGAPQPRDRDQLVDLDALTPDDHDHAEQHPHNPTGGDTMSTPATTGESASIEQTRTALQAILAAAAIDLDGASAVYEAAKGTTVAAEQMLGDLTTADLDAQTLADISAIQECAAAQEADAQRLLTSTEATHAATDAALAGLNERHAMVEEAVTATAHAAQTGWYRH